MNTLSTRTENSLEGNETQGVQLADIRQQKGYTIDYVASKLHLRARIIESLEHSEFHLLPEPVFVKGYLRAYTKLLGISPDPYLALFDKQCVEKKPERALLWQQNKREFPKSEYLIRWFTILFAFGVIVAVGVWWQKNSDNQEQLFSKKNVSTNLSFHQTPVSQNTKLKLTHLSKLHSLLNGKPEMSPLENVSG